MKAAYQKPFLAVELFSLSQTSARDCADTIPKENVTLSDPATCVWDFGGTSIFVASGACDLDGEAMGYGCYNNPSEGNYIFRS